MPLTPEPAERDFFLGASLHWQPVVDLGSGRIEGAEALLRPQNGLPPNEMLSLIDRENEWEVFTRWTMERVLSDLSTLPPLPGPFFAFLNLSPRQCVSSFLFSWRNRFPPGVLPVIEVLEEALDPEQTSVLLDTKRWGFRIAVDDFGTGHSNISRLLDLPVDFVKIDRTLIQTTRKNDRDLVAGVVRAIGKTAIRILGEGIETEDHVRFAARIGCVSGQGWHYGKPMPIEELSRGLKRKN
ncbi:MAG: EAL domain-containing protein [Leptospirillum sp.]